MKFFLDTAIRDDIRRMAELGFVDGVTTNPSLLSEVRAPYREVLADICEMVDGPVSAEVVATDVDGMVSEAHELAAIAKNITVKIPMGPEGLVAVRHLRSDGIDCNVTLVFSTNQALLAAKAGARFVSPFIGRLDDAGHDGMGVVEEIITVYDNYEFDTEVIVASVRHPLHVVHAGLIGADIVTMPTKILEAMFRHPLTEDGTEKFLAAWRSVRKS